MSRDMAKQRACHKRYRETHREIVNARTREWQKANPEKMRACQKRYYDAHKEQRLAHHREWCENNRERTRAYQREYYARHAEEIRAKVNARYAEKRDERLAARAARRAQKAAAAEAARAERLAAREARAAQRAADRAALSAPAAYAVTMDWRGRSLALSWPAPDDTCEGCALWTGEKCLACGRDKSAWHAANLCKLFGGQWKEAGE